MSLTQVTRVEAKVTDWRSAMPAFAVAVTFGLLASSAEPGLPTQGTFLRFSLTAAAIGVLLALEDYEGESTAALPVSVAARLRARLMPVLAVWGATLGVVLGLSGFPQGTRRLVTEATVLGLSAILLACIGRRSGIPQFTTVAAIGLAAVFLVTLVLPESLRPWWNGVDPPVEPPLTGWYIAAGALVLAIFGVGRRITAWAFEL